MKYLYFAFILILLSGCANPVIPTGGKKDDKIPQLKRTNLITNNFKENYIKLEFDEYITLENGQNSISIQPKHTTFVVSNNAKTVRIKLDSNLKPNTTYVLSITSGIKDVNEGNLYVLSYVFSTGSTIDTNFVRYKIPSQKENKSLKIGLNTQTIDSVKKLKFEYLYQINGGEVLIPGLGSTPFKAWIFTDKNNDDIPDEYAPIYYDTISINTDKEIILNDWNDPRNKKIIYYKDFTKVFKVQNDENTYGFSNAVYIDKDSALFCQYNSDTLPTLDLRKEINEKINNKILGISGNKEYTIIIDKCGIRNISITDKISYKEDENYFYITSRLEIDSINFKVNILNDSIRFYSKINYQASNTKSTLKVSSFQKKDKVIMMVYQNNKLILVKKISLKNDLLFYMDPSAYKVVFYHTNSFSDISFNFEKMHRINVEILENEIILKPNWDEVLQLIFK